MTILIINKLALELVARDFSDNHSPNNGGPTKTSRALAIIHLAARDAYAQTTAAYKPKLAGLPNRPDCLQKDEITGAAAVLGAGIRAATLLYPDFSTYINEQSIEFMKDSSFTDLAAVAYGAEIAEKWVASRAGDGSSMPQTDSMYSDAPGHHRPDPVSKNPALGRTWGQVKPFVLADVATDAPLEPPPKLDSKSYAKAFDEVFVCGRNNVPERSAKFQRKAEIGIFWGYDGANKLGTPPRLYNQVVLSTEEFKCLPFAAKVNVLAAINAAMADAGIAAWHWKYTYDFWRPVIGIREADKGFGPTAQGDGNSSRKHCGDPFWLPLGAPQSNPFPAPSAGAKGFNVTPNFPAYPSGHATFGSACFETFAALVGKSVKEITTSFVSDEFNGATQNNEGITRPKWEQTFTLKEAIDQNNISRIYLGVHWIFDATGGETVGRAVAKMSIAAFKT